MGDNKSYIEESKVHWKNGGAKRHPTNEELIVGSVQRIAAATEAMAVNHVKLQADLEWYKKRYNESLASNEALERSNRTLRGWITRLKNKSNGQ